MDKRVLAFRAGVADLSAAGRGRRYPQSLQRLAVQYWHAAHRDGRALRHAAADLGVSDATLQRWAEEKPADPVLGTMREVFVKDPTGLQRLSVVTPDGYRIEGLDVPAVSHLLRTLR